MSVNTVAASRRFSTCITLSASCPVDRRAEPARRPDQPRARQHRADVRVLRRRGADAELWFWDRNAPTRRTPVLKLRTNKPLRETSPTRSGLWGGSDLLGRQIPIVGTPEDLAELACHAASLGARAILSEIPRDDLPELHIPHQLLDANLEHQFYLLPGDLEAVEIMATEDFDEPEARFVNDRLSPVIPLSCHRTRTRTRSGAAGCTSGSTRSHPLYNSAARLYEALVRFVGDWATSTEGEKVRVGPQAAERARKGALRLKSSTGTPLTLEDED